MRKNIEESCKNIKFNVKDFSIYSEVENRNHREFYNNDDYLPENVVKGEWDYSILFFIDDKQEYVMLNNMESIDLVKDCTKSYLDSNFIGLDDMARFISDDRFKKFKSESLELEVQKAINDKNITWSKLIYFYSELSKNIDKKIIENIS